jgi:alpha-1,6-mannosyltransferase
MVAVDLVLLAVAWFHVLLTPYTKVEESFNLHAAHDVFFYGVSPNALKRVRTVNTSLWRRY